jgi:hypothetical protein
VFGGGGGGGGGGECCATMTTRRPVGNNPCILCSAHGFWQNDSVIIRHSFTPPNINCYCCGLSTDLSGMRTLGELRIYFSIWLMKMATL